MTDPAPGEETPAFDLGAFERLAGDGDAAALPMLYRLLDHIEQGGAVAEAPRLADAVAGLLAAETPVLGPEACDRLAFHARHLAALFRAAWPDGPDRVWRRVRDAHGASATGDATARVLAAASVAMAGNFDWADALWREGKTALPFFLAGFTHRALLDADADARRNELLALAPQIEDIPLRASTVPVLSEAWMLCSYATAPGRHALKRSLNRLMDGLLEPIRPRVPSRRRRRPTLVVVAEVLLARHAMYKTYAFFLGQLRARFRLVLVTLAGKVDPPGEALFDETHAFPFSAGVIKTMADAVVRLRPAIVYYPSAGMSLMTVLLCNLRLAPIQIVSTGHPATTHSPAMDYMITGHEHFGGAACFSEQVMLLRSGGALFVPDPSAAAVEPTVREAPETLRVAVPATAMKLNAPFLALCRRVAGRSGRDVEFSFFPDVTGLRHDDCRRQIEAALPGAVVHPRLAYGDYLGEINRCDMRLGTFPFGGANTTVDALRQGLPSVVLEGPEPHSRTDMRFVRLFGLPEWLIAGSEAEYERAALRLIGDDEERCRLSRLILDAGPDSVLYGQEHRLYPTDFTETVWWLYDNHEAVKDSDKHVWTWADRQALGGG